MIPNRSTKIGRNELCPCGSKMKYKRCHGAVTALPEPKAGALDAQARKLNAKPTCLSPADFHVDCNGSIIDSHTVSRSGSLGAIVRDGHVYSYALSIQSLEQTGGRVLPKLVGWRVASTFPGFCKHHDKQLFAPLEDQPFTGTAEQCFLLGYRAVARELYTKQNSFNQAKLRSALASSTRDASLKMMIDDFNHGVELGLRDSQAHKERYDRVLVKRDWQSCRALVVEFNGVFPIQCATGLFPLQDIHGNRLQDIGPSAHSPSTITVASFAADGKSFVVLSWLDDSDEVSRKLADSIAACAALDMPGVIAALLLQTSENCHLAPDWYDPLSEDGKKWVEAQVMEGISPLAATPPPARAGGAQYLGAISVSQTTRL